MPDDAAHPSTPAIQTIIRQASSPEQYDDAKRLFQEYASALHIDLCFQGFSHELTVLNTMYGPPDGCLLIAYVSEQPAGCVALRKIGDGVGELKRMYVKREFQQRGIGNALATTLLAKAGELRYRTVRLDTLVSMSQARSIYQRLGFRPCGAYYVNPLPDVIYMEKIL
jgi:putative acetyltransferase